MNLDEITAEFIKKLKANLANKVSQETTDNILTVLGHVLVYANEIELIDRVPKVRLFNPERPEPVPFTLSELNRFLAAAKDRPLQSTFRPCWLVILG